MELVEFWKHYPVVKRKKKKKRVAKESQRISNKGWSSGEGEPIEMGDKWFTDQRRKKVETKVKDFMVA